MDNVWTNAPLTIQEKSFVLQPEKSKHLENPVILQKKGQEKEIHEKISLFSLKYHVH
jgi:hypothetical protein